MAQESWKEIDETEFQKPEGPILCANNCGFFGSPMTSNLCSKCYRDLVKPPTVASSSVAIESVPERAKKLSLKISGNADKKESEETLYCFSCRRRVGLAGFACRCGSTFCSTHRHPEAHECSFDYKFAGREAIAKDNPVVKAEKIEKI